MLDDLNLANIIFLDIETVPQYKEFKKVPTVFQEFWEKKSSYFRKEDESAEDVYQRAGIYAEFGKIICISVGRIKQEKSVQKIELRSFANDDEKELLTAFAEWLNNILKKKKIKLCAHNGKEFDFPYIARRMLIHQLKLPEILNVAGKKPWEVDFLDTLELWKFGDYKHYTSLDLLAALFGIESPKDNMDGSMVYKKYWEENKLDEITDYCNKDVITIIQLLLKYSGREFVPEENISIK